MNIEYLGLIVLSAFFHAFYNFLMKKTDGNLGFLLTIFIVATGFAIPIALVTEPWAAFSRPHLPLVYGAAFFYILYQIWVSKAYERGNISALYPLTVLSPLFIPLWAFVFLSETITLLTGLGIMLTVLGAFFVKLNAFTIEELKKLFAFHEDYLGARYALAASFIYSFGAILDKSGVASFPTAVYIALILAFMTINMAIYWAFFERKAVWPFVATYWKAGLLGGIALYLSFFIFRIALREVFVSLAVPVRQVSIVFAFGLGIVFLRETFKASIAAGALIIILGIVLLNMGMP